jgi:2-polyprenyl-3-methyl-5-hydroxy-6-metoxy-1,4-benzoquinol methylase
MKIKKNVSQFDKDAADLGGYEYSGNKLSSILANKRMNDAVEGFFNFSNQTILDCGCGDGKFTKNYIKLGAKRVVAVDPAKKAIETAIANNCNDNVVFSVGDVYNLKSHPEIIAQKTSFDVAILRGVLHHVSDQALAVKKISEISNSILILEPNGSNPVLKIIEKVSKYHIEHEEQSFNLKKIKKWLLYEGFTSIKHKYINLVPFFCPDWFAKCADFLTPTFEKIPLLRVFACGQIIIVASK